MLTSVCAALALAATSESAARVEVLNPIVHAPLNEISGVVRSRTYADTYWVHNDSGDSARIFGTNALGEVLIPPFERNRYTLGTAAQENKPLFSGVSIELAANIDWEDIATDGTNLFLADTGNNGNARRDLSVYVIPEPNPLATTRTTALMRIPVRFPEQREFPAKDWHYDCEAIFSLGGRLYFLTKQRADRDIRKPLANTELYELAAMRPHRVNNLKRIGSFSGLTGWVTGADISPDGRNLAVLCGSPKPSVHVFKGDQPSTLLRSKPQVIELDPQKAGVESICWIDDRTLMVISEAGERWKVSL